MSRVNLPLKNWINLFVCLCTLVSLLAAAPVRAEVDGPAYIITVNSAGEANIKDSNITLREALLITRGGTTAQGLGRTLSDSEKAQISSCTFTGSTNSWSTSVGCGAGYEDVINFGGLGFYPVIPISLPLPAINDTAITTLDGGVTIPYINAAGIGAGDALTISSNNNILKNIGIYAAPNGSNILVSGNYNSLQYLHSSSAKTNGVHITGSHNTLDNTFIGLSVLNTCQGNQGHGVLIDGDSQYNTIQNSVISCNTGYGIHIPSSVIHPDGFHTIGPNVEIGTDLTGTSIQGNSLVGLNIGSNKNLVVSSTVRYNTLDGIAISGNLNSVMTSTLTTNSGSGLLLSGTAYMNFIGCNYLCGKLGGNRISGNGRYGIEMASTAVNADVRSNLIAANHIGINDTGILPEGNALGGILIDGAHDNILGGTDLYGNSIAGNLRSGVILDHAAYNNHLKRNYIGISRTGNSYAAVANQWRGIHLLNGAHHNEIGAGSYENMIEHNGLDGIFLVGSATANNTIDGNRVAANGAAGIRIDSSAHDNIVGSSAANFNLITDNSGPGVILSNLANNNLIAYNYIGVDYPTPNNAPNLYGIQIISGAHHNTIGGVPGVLGQKMNIIQSNSKDGVYLDGPTTTLNTISNNVIANNTNGIVITNTANTNSIMGNYIGLLINLNAAGNHLYGIRITGGAYENKIGSPGGGNLVSDSGYPGIVMDGAATSYNRVNNNIVYANQFAGLAVGDSAHHNIIGATLSEANDFIKNHGYGADIGSSAHDNTISYNNIGVSSGVLADFDPNSPSIVSTGNEVAGVYVHGAAHDNRFFNNTVANNFTEGFFIANSGTTNNEFTLNWVHDNNLDGILETSEAAGNWWSHVLMWGNNGLGIDKSGQPDTLNTLNRPTRLRIDSAVSANGLMTIKGFATGSVINTKSVKVELYTAALNPAGFAEGQTYLGEAYTLANGSWTITTAIPATGCYVAFETITILGMSTSSEFSRSTCALFTPFIRR